MCIKLCLLAGLLGLVHGAKKDAGRFDVIQELRRSVKPKLDPSGKIAHYRKHFVRNDRDTGEYTHLIYNCSRHVDQFVALETPAFGVKNVTCEPDRVIIETASAENSEKLHSALVASETGLLYGAAAWGCLSNR
jgi:hypothetical protein